MVEEMTRQQLLSRFPVLYHVAHRSSWDSICRHGLLSTSALLDLFEVKGKDREELESCRRPESVTITHPKHGSAVIRDQKPIDESRLKASLQGMSAVEWYRLLNSMVFFWTTEKSLGWFLNARAYRHDAHCVITVDTQRLVETHKDHICLSSINSGSTLSDRLPPRGASTFKTIEGFSSLFPVELYTTP